MSIIPYLMSCSFTPTAVGKLQLATILLSLENLLNPRSRVALCACKLPEYDFLHVNFASRIVATLAHCALFHCSLQ